MIFEYLKKRNFEKRTYNKVEKRTTCSYCNFNLKNNTQVSFESLNKIQFFCSYYCFKEFRKIYIKELQLEDLKVKRSIYIMKKNYPF